VPVVKDCMGSVRAKGLIPSKLESDIVGMETEDKSLSGYRVSAHHD
jgi:hypothetical protein